MCGENTDQKRRQARENAANVHAEMAQAVSATEIPSEYALSSMVREDLGVSIEPQALRMFLRTRFDKVARLAHRIHDGKR